MKSAKKLIVLSFMILLPFSVNGQILISLLFGDALNSEKIEFGLAGGMTRSDITSISESEGLNSFDLGFYFHILLKNNSYLSTGVHVKSNVGGKGMPTYNTGDADIDAVFAEGELTKKIPGFYVPILFHQRFNNRWYIEAGPQLGLIYKAQDIFEVSEKGTYNIRYENEVMDQYKRIDAGLMGGIGYKFKQQTKSMSAGVSYYYGLANVSKNPDLTIKNSALYFFIKIPIGANPKAE